MEELCANPPMLRRLHAFTTQSIGQRFFRSHIFSQPMHVTTPVSWQSGYSVKLSIGHRVRLVWGDAGIKVVASPRLALSQCHVPRRTIARSLWLLRALGTICRHNAVEFTPLTLSNANWKHFYFPRRFSFFVFFYSVFISNCILLDAIVVFRVD